MMIKYLIATIKKEYEFGSIIPTPHNNTYTVELESEPSVKDWEEFMQEKAKKQETVIAISKLGETK
jgi:hypothetical protein